jgi:hypothetical protein
LIFSRKIALPAFQKMKKSPPTALVAKRNCNATVNSASMMMKIKIKENGLDTVQLLRDFFFCKVSSAKSADFFCSGCHPSPVDISLRWSNTTLRLAGSNSRKVERTSSFSLESKSPQIFSNCSDVDAISIAYQNQSR